MTCLKSSKIVLDDDGALGVQTGNNKLYYGEAMYCIYTSMNIF